MKISRAQFVLSPDDVSRMVTELVPVETASLLELVFANGALLIKLGRKSRLLDLRPALELKVAALTTTHLTLTTHIKGLPLIDRLIRDRTLPKIVEDLAQAGLSYGDGRIELDLDQLLNLVPVSFKLEKVLIMRGGIIIAVRDLAYEQPARADATALPAPSAPGEAGAANMAVPVVPSALAVVPPQEALPLYDRIRGSVKRNLDRATPGPLKRLTPWLLALPDLTVLLWRLTRHAGVDGRRKAVAAAALGYVIWPLDFLPDFIPALGWLDDTTIALLALTSIVSAAPPELRAELWPGEKDVLAPLQSALNLFERVVGRRMFDALKRKISV